MGVGPLGCVCEYGHLRAADAARRLARLKCLERYFCAATRQRNATPSSRPQSVHTNKKNGPYIYTRRKSLSLAALPRRNREANALQMNHRNRLCPILKHWRILAAAPLLV